MSAREYVSPKRTIRKVEESAFPLCVCYGLFVNMCMEGVYAPAHPSVTILRPRDSCKIPNLSITVHENNLLKYNSSLPCPILKHDSTALACAALLQPMSSEGLPHDRSEMITAFSFVSDEK